jgi:hypothetical protein
VKPLLLLRWLWRAGARVKFWLLEINFEWQWNPVFLKLWRTSEKLVRNQWLLPYQNLKPKWPADIRETLTWWNFKLKLLENVNTL